MGEIEKQTLSGVKWSAIENFTVRGIQFVLGLMMARLLTPADYGTIGMLGIFIAVASTFTDSGISNALIRKQNRTEVDYATMFYFNIAVSCLCYIVLFFISPYVAIFFKIPILSPILRVVSLNLVIGAFAAVQGVRLMINVDFKTQAKVSTISSLVSGIIGVYMAYMGWGVWALAWQSVMSTILRTVILWYFAHWHPILAFSRKSFGEMFGFGSNLLISGLLNTIYGNLIPVLIGRFYTPKDLGYYTRGSNFPSFLSTNITGMLQKVTFPILAKIQDNDSRLKYAYRKYIKVTSIVIVFCMVLMSVLAKPITVVLLTEKWLPAVVFMQIFCYAKMLDHICVINLNLLQVKGRSDLFLRLEIIKKTISLLILLAAVPFGVLAVCISQLVYANIAVFINTYYTGKFFNMGYLEQVKDFAPYLLFSWIACIPTYLLTLLPVDNIFLIVFGGILASALYILVLHLKKEEVYEEYFVGKCMPMLKRYIK